jgi:hypothetical protein
LDCEKEREGSLNEIRLIFYEGEWRMDKQNHQMYTTESNAAVLKVLPGRSNSTPFKSTQQLLIQDNVWGWEVLPPPLHQAQGKKKKTEDS